MTKVKRAMAVLLCAVLLLTAAPLGGLAGLDLHLPDLSALFATKVKAADPTSGTCGDNLTWSYDTSIQTLTISGTGAMLDYSRSFYNVSHVTTAPWRPYYTTMKTVVIDNGVTSLGGCAFTNCTGLTSVTIGNGVTSIGSSAFDGCHGLTSITIGKSVTSIGDSAFYDCSGLTSITVVSGNPAYQSVGNCLIETGNKMLIVGCKTSVIPTDGSVTSIGERAFENCAELISVTIPDSVVSIGSEAFYGCTGLTNISVASGNPAYQSAGNCLIETESKMLIVGCKTSVIPTDGSVTSIGERAFENHADLTSITIPGGVTSIGNYAFCNCTGLTSVTIPGGVTSIGNYAFHGCTGLASVTIPDSVASIGDYAFHNTGYYNKNTNWCDGILYIGPHLIKAKSTLKGTYTIRQDTVSIADEAFWDCTELTRITIPISVTSISSSAFHGCTGLTHITVASGNPVYHSAGNCLIDSENKNLIAGCNSSVIPADGSITSIDNFAFSGRTGLKSIMIPDSITSIGDYAFNGCTGLTSITIPGSVISIGSSAFYYCSGLSSITVASLNPVYHSEGNCLVETGSKTLIAGCKSSVIPMNGSVTSIGSEAFCGCTGLTSVTIPNSITSIGNSAFCGCTGLTSITIPESVTSIGWNAFCKCTGLLSITIPDSVTSIGWYAFSDCTGLACITILASVTSIGDWVFSGCTRLTRVSIPSGVTYIGNDAFCCCNKLTDVYYQGSEAEWKEIVLGLDNQPLLNARIHFLDEIYTANFLVDGEVYKTEEFTATQESIHEPDVPEKPGYTGAWAPYILNEQDLTIEAVYTPIEYTATFIADGKIVKEIPFTVETAIFALPSVPEKEGHAGKWESFAFNYEDLTIHAVYTPNTYTATVIADGATIAEIPFTYGQKSIQLPEVPKKEGHTGVWPPYSLGASDLTIEAVYTPIEYTVTYYADDQVIGSGAIPYGNSIWRPRTPQKEGYTFSGWTPKVPETMPANDLTFYAVFKPNPYTVTWLVDGAEFKTETILFGDLLTAPTPEKEGYTFSGWDAEIPASMPAKDLTFRGSFSLNQYTLRLISDGAELVNTKVTHGAPFQLLTAPTKAGYTLLGWAADPAATTAAYAVGGTYTFTADTTLYAVWQKDAAPASVTIKGFTPTKNVDYKTTITFTADLSNAPAGATAHWIIDGRDVYTGESYTVKQATKDYTVQVKLYAADGTELYASEVETVKVSTGFFAKLIAFFRQLFGALPVITQAIKETL